MAAEDVLVSTQWVADHGNDPGIKLVEVDVDTNAYDEGHIAGAVVGISASRAFSVRSRYCERIVSTGEVSVGTATC